VYGTLKSAWDRMLSYAATKITALLAKITGLKDKVVNAMRSAGTWLKDAGRRIIQGLIDGVTRKINDLTELLKSLTDMIPSWKGPASRDEKLLYENGELIMDGLIRAVGDKIPAFASLLRGFTNDIPGMLTPGAGGAALQAPTTDARSYGSSVHQDVKIYYPVAERSSKAVKKSLDFAGAFGEV
jgi:phage-related protein